MDKEQFVNKIANVLNVEINLAKRNELEDIYNDVKDANLKIIESIISDLEDIEDDLDGSDVVDDIHSAVVSLKSIC